ncbi:DUF6924 domain-containing protein [Polymorphospora rubra]|uniref:DUF6924 domain-containing protein n=1 Tax=Polymorphospora rubra TaxID=338584 RepID=A0A810MQZ5_9ACTN|nr:hypothetical protein [Polymorphospora rubra]BCJ63114.1 hypothetical protein Prubr_01350 [Polymorphospora rubra]
MTRLPQPADLTSLVLRTDFADDDAWHALQEQIGLLDRHPHATFVSDPAYAGITAQAVVDIDAAAGDDKLTYLFLADATTMTDDENPLLAVDTYDEPGRTFRLPVRWYADVSANLAIGNVDFADFADAADGAGTYQGPDRE